MRRAVLAVIGMLALAGCGKDLHDHLAEHEAGVKAQLDRVAPLREAAKAAPPVTVDEVRYDGPPPRYPSAGWVGGVSNAAIAYLEDLDNLTELGNVPFRIEGSGSINRCAAAFATHREPYDPVLATVPPPPLATYLAEGLFAHCEGLRYLFVIRSAALAYPSEVTTAFCPEAPPSADGGADAGLPAGGADAGAPPDAGPRPICKRFDGGLFRADVLVFDVRSGKGLGGFRLAAESSPRIDVTLYSDQDRAPGPDLKRQIRAAFAAAVAKAVPSAGEAD